MSHTQKRIKKLSDGFMMGLNPFAKVWILWFVLMFFVLLLANCQGQVNSQSNDEYQYNHSIKKNEYFRELWASKGFIACLSCFQSHDGEAIVLGNLSGGSEVNLLRLDVATNTVKWTKSIDSYGPMWVDKKAIYTSSSGMARIYNESQIIGTATVVAHDVFTGSTIWSNNAYGARRISFLSASDSIVSAVGQEYINSSHFDIDTGKRFERFDEITPVIYSDDDITLTYRWLYSGGLLQAIETNSQNLLWELYSKMETFYVEEDILIINSTRDKGLGSVQAVDLATGKVKWSYDGVVSNVAVDDSKVYFFQITGDEWGSNTMVTAIIPVLDINSGERITTLDFIPAAIKPMYGTNPYNIFADDNIVVIHFGDSRQLFAFQFTPPPVAP